MVHAMNCFARATLRYIGDIKAKHPRMASESTPRALRWKCFEFAGTVWHVRSESWLVIVDSTKRGLSIQRGIAECRALQKLHVASAS